MEKFHIHTRYGDIIHDPVFKGFEYMIDFRRSVFSEEFEDLTLKEIEDRLSWDAEQMAESTNFLYGSQKDANVFYSLHEEKPVGIAAFARKEKSKFVLICPGGGYSAICAVTEGYHLAKKLNESGFSAFVFSYSVGKDAAAPHPQEDIAGAVKWIIANAEKFRIDVEDYIVIGFSAGAHVAGCFGTKQLGFEKYSLPKPKLLILGYPVITMGKYTHIPSREYLLGKNPGKDDIDTYSVERNITADYPNTYLWQCKGDPMVPFENSQLLAQALKREKVKHRYEVFPYAVHGLPVDADSYHKAWLTRALDFYDEL